LVTLQWGWQLKPNIRMSLCSRLSIILGAGFLDVINGILVAIGIEKVTPNLLALAYLYFDLTFID
jgi:hypothetical protein